MQVASHVVLPRRALHARWGHRAEAGVKSNRFPITGDLTAIGWERSSLNRSEEASLLAGARSQDIPMEKIAASEKSSATVTLVAPKQQALQPTQMEF
jgi:hypothetical protein